MFSGVEVKLQRAINYEGFEPTDELSEYAQVVFKNCKMIAPSKSFVSLNLRKVEVDTFEGSVSIKSLQKNFFNSLSASTPKGVLEQLYVNLKKQIDGWKEVRFNTENTLHQTESLEETSPL